MKKTDLAALIAVCVTATLQTVFFILKLCSVVAWEWIWVFMPSIIFSGVAIIGLTLLFATCIIIAFIKEGDNKK
jgi:hypothetical protein